MSKIIARLASKPKTLFLIDSLGAFVTAFFLFVIVRTFEGYFGMPPIIVTYLSLIAVLLCFFSMTCFLVVKDDWRLFLKMIGIANFIYCAITIALVVNFYDTVTILCVTYFVVESIIVCTLAYVELRISFSGIGVKSLF